MMFSFKAKEVLTNNGLTSNEILLDGNNHDLNILTNKNQHKKANTNANLRVMTLIFSYIKKPGLPTTT